MRAGSVFLALFLIICALAIVVWIGRGPDVAVPVLENAEPEQAIPEPSPTGPHPKAVAEETVHDFGLMQHGKTGSHLFEIQNNGEAPLKLVARKQDMTCQCTGGHVRKNVLQPGESTQVEISWAIKNPSPQFLHSAIVRTNDPENQKIRLVVRGQVGRAVVITPETEWTLGTIADGEPTVVTGTLYSELADKFEVVDIKCSTPLLTAKATLLTPEELEAATKREPSSELMPDGPPEDENTDGPPEHEHADGEQEEQEEEEEVKNVEPPKAKCGYSIEATLRPEMAVGRFREHVTLRTDVPDSEPVTVYLGGRRSGPVQFFGTSPGARWVGKAMLVRMGRFPAADGKQATLSMIIKTFDQPLEVFGVETTSEWLKASVEEMEGVVAKDRKRYRLSLEVPPGLAPAACIKDRIINVILTTNHPQAGTIELNVEYVSY